MEDQGSIEKVGLDALEAAQEDLRRMLKRLEGMHLTPEQTEQANRNIRGLMRALGINVSE